MKKPVLILLVAGLAACSPQAEDAPQANHLENEIASQGPVTEQAAAVDVRAVWLRPHLGGRDVTAAYFFAELTEGDADLLTGARINGAERVELHGHFMAEGGVMQMREVGARRIEPDAPLVFTPGGMHLMVYGLETVVEGDAVSGVLIFQNAGEIPVTFTVRAMPPAQPTDY